MAGKSRGVWGILARTLPKTEFMDFAYAWLKFVRVHHRAPSRNRMLFNDMLFRAKMSPEILHPLRLYSTDKEYFKKLVAAEIGVQYSVPTLAVLHTEAEIDAFDFPTHFCAKPTHASGVVQLVRGGAPNRDEMKSWLTLNHYYTSRERNYRSLVPKVIVEPLIFGEHDINDFRLYCYKGEPRLIGLDVGKYSRYTRAFYTTDWVKQDYSLGYPLYDGEIEKPDCLDEMLKVAATLSKDLEFVRVDFYTNGDQFYLGELTHCHASASQVFIPRKAEVRASAEIFG